MVIKSRKRKVKTPIKDLVYEMFMQSPIPMSITRAKNGIYVEVNQAAAKYMGLKSKDIIGRNSLELGHIPEEQRNLFIDAIRENGFAMNIPLEINVQNQGVVKIFFGVFPIKMGEEDFFLSFAHAISNHQTTIEKVKNDKFSKMSFLDYQYVKEELKQYKLTPRQKEIVLLSAKGHSNRDISQKLFISEYTVKGHMKEIFLIIGIRRRNELFPKLLNLH